MQRYIIDRIEGAFAVCEASDKSVCNIELYKLPERAREGDSIVFDGKRYEIDFDETAERRVRVKEKMDSLFTD